MVLMTSVLTSRRRIAYERGELATFVSSQRRTHMSRRAKQLKQAFLLFDKDGDGTIDHDEFRILLEGLGIKQTPEETADMLTELDGDGSGIMEFDEFALLMEARAPLTFMSYHCPAGWHPENMSRCFILLVVTSCVAALPWK